MRATQGLTFSSPTLEGVDDFDGLYVQQLVQLSHGLLPYRDFAYSYPPLFLLVLYPFYLIGGANFAAVPIVVSDAATAVVIFYFVDRFASKRLALLSGLAYSLSPFAPIMKGMPGSAASR